jgi:ATP synthase protein I
MNKKTDSFDTGAKDDLENRLNDINKRLGREVKGEQTGEIKKPGNSGMAQGMRIASEFVSAILVGAAIGYAIDWVFGVAPFAMISFLLLGFVAGVLNVMRAAKDM